MKKIILLISVLALVACDDASKSVDNHDHPQLTTGKQLYDHHCAGCHGEGGHGKLMQAIPPNLFTSDDKSGVIEMIRGGGNHEQRQMPVMQTMSKDEAQKIVDHLWVLKAQFDQKTQR